MEWSERGVGGGIEFAEVLAGAQHGPRLSHSASGKPVNMSATAILLARALAGRAAEAAPTSESVGTVWCPQS